MNLTLTGDQQAAADKIVSFLCDPTQKYFVLKGYSGTGKSTLVEHLINVLIPNVEQTIRLLNPDALPYTITLTATTNKAAENLSFLVKTNEVSTVHSAIGVVPWKDYTTGKESLKLRSLKEDLRLYRHILIVDEASFADAHLLHFIEKQTVDCKVLFIGDPAQLTPVFSSTVPAFHRGYPEAELREVVRHEGHILNFANMFRNAVETGEFVGYQPDGVEIVHVNQEDFLALIEQEFSRNSWECNDSKILTWTNRKAVEYNNYIATHLTGSHEFKADDYVINNAFAINGHTKLGTDQTLRIESIKKSAIDFRYHTGFEDKPESVIQGKLVIFKECPTKEWFVPDDRKDKLKVVKKLVEAGNPQLAQSIDTTWIDIRGAYSSTVNKAQGSTYNKVFIDVNDIAKCNSGDQIARLMYVAASRARNQVILTGDFG